MRDIKTILNDFTEICASPRKQLDKVLSSGKKAIGVMPYFCPEEIVYAAGMIPFGVWGAEIQANESKRYFPAFICSLLQTTLEMGIRGDLNGLSAMMIPICCDSLKSMGTNWEYGVKTIPVINVAYAQNRKIKAGVDFTVSQMKKIRSQIAVIAGHEITDADVACAIDVYNANRTALKAFVSCASEHPEIISAQMRSAVIKAGYFMDRTDHTKLVKELTDAVSACEKTKWNGLRVVTTGIIADSPALLEIFDEYHIAIVGDQIAHESVSFDTLTPKTDDPFVGMAMRLGETEGSSVLFDLGKVRGRKLAELAKEKKADGVIWVMTKFCDPEEFDYVPCRRMLDTAEIPVLQIETDQQMTSFEQVRSAVQAFTEMIF